MNDETPLFPGAGTNSASSAFTNFSNFHPVSVNENDHSIDGKPLNIVVDAGAIEDRASRNRGIGKYLANQFTALAALRPDWNIFLSGVEDNPVKEFGEIFGGYHNCKYICWEDLPGTRANLLYLPNPMSFTMPQIMQIGQLLNLPMVCTFHDLIPLVFHQLYLDHDDFYKGFYFDQLNRLKDQCSLFLCNSEFTSKDLFERAQISPSKLGVISAGVKDRFADSPSQGKIDAVLWNWGLQAQNFMLFTGVPDMRKNSQGMFAAVAAASQSLNRNLKLVIVGDCPEFLIERLRRIQRESGLADDAVIYTGYVSEDELTTFYHSALCLLFPSMYEGFGLPIVEAMMAGLPVIAGNNSSQPEAAGDAGLLVDVYDVRQIASAILELYTKPELRQELAARGKIHSRQFTWERVAKLTAAYLSKFFG